MSLSVEEKGAANPTTVVLIHGAGVAGWMWRLQWESLSDYHCLVVDLPDHGASRGTPFGTIEACAADVIGLIEARAHGGKAHLIGHSLGAKIALAALAQAPERVHSAVVASALVRPSWMGSMVASHAANALSVWMMGCGWLRRLQAKAFEFPDDEYRARFIEGLEHLTAGSLDRPGRAFASSLRLPAGLGQARCPVCVLAGTLEPKAMRDSVRDAVAALPGAGGFLVEKARHNFPWTHSALFNALLRAWLAGDELPREGLQALSAPPAARSR